MGPGITSQESRPTIGAPLHRLALAAWVLAIAGCANDEVKTSESTAVAARAPTAEAPPAEAGTMQAKMSAGMGGATAAGETGAATVPPAIPRKIIYNARIVVVVESVTALGDKVAKLVKDAGGYVSDTDQTSYTHSQRSASWTVRVPVERFDAFLAAVSRLGEVQQTHVDSQDVTQEYYDVEARIANKQQEEKRLKKHLDDSTGKLEDILAVERELSRVRGEIETMQGRIRYLANVTALSTVTISASEVRDYVPPVRATFAAEVSRTFARSVERLVEFGRGLALAAVALAPWVPFLVLAALPFVVLWRRRAGRPRAAVATPPEPRPS